MTASPSDEHAGDDPGYRATPLSGTQLVSNWLSLRCACSYCSVPTLREAFPDLIGRLANPRDADKSSGLWLEWFCPVNHPDHRRMQGTATTIAAGDRYCGGCRSLDRFYADHAPGTTMKNREVARAKIEQPVIDELRKQLPEVTFSYQLSVVVSRVFEPRTGRAITPDLLLLDQRVVVEIDGSGVGGYASRHDSLEGVANDTARDQAMAALGFRTIAFGTLDHQRCRSHQPTSSSRHPRPHGSSPSSSRRSSGQRRSFDHTPPETSGQSVTGIRTVH